MKAFGKTNITSTDLPKCCRGNTLAQMKKCASHYFPNKGSQWIDGKGNLTRAQCVMRLLPLCTGMRSDERVWTVKVKKNHSNRMSSK